MEKHLLKIKLLLLMPKKIINLINLISNHLQIYLNVLILSVLYYHVNQQILNK
jgi:hypothetical protein